MTNHDELSYYLSLGLAVRVDGVTINRRNLEHVDLILKEDDSYICLLYTSDAADE